MEAEAIVVFITAPTREEAIKLAELMVNERLAACVQVLPETLSLYRWEGAIQHDPEHLILCKTMRGRFAELEQAVRAVHSYTTPQIVAVPAVEVSQPYFAWLTESVSRQQGQ